MAYVRDVTEFIRLENGVQAYFTFSDALGGVSGDNQESAFYQMTNYHGAMILALCENVVSTHVVTLVAYEGTDTDGGGSATISGRSASATSTSTDDVISLVLHVDAAEMTTAYEYLGGRIATDDPDGTENVFVGVIPLNPRYGQATPPA